MRQHVLDANALHRYLLRGSGHEIVASALRKSREERCSVLISAVNWGELCYTLVKRIGRAEAEHLLSGLPEKLGMLVIDIDQARAERASDLKIKYGLPYADAYAAELTGTHNVLVTADVKDFQRVPKIRLLKLPPKKAN